MILLCSKRSFLELTQSRNSVRSIVSLRWRHRSKALAVLNSDDAHDLPLHQDRQRCFRADFHDFAAAVHTRVAEKVQSRRLAAIAMHVRLDAFEKVKTVIDDMVTALLTGPTSLTPTTTSI